MYADYKMPYWEFIRMGERLLIIVIVEYFDSDNRFKGMLAFICIFSYLLILTKIQPYEDKAIIYLEKISSMTCMFSIFFCLIINDGTFYYITILSYIFLVQINAFFILFIFTFHIHTFKQKARITIESISNSIIKKSIFRPNHQNEIGLKLEKGREHNNQTRDENEKREENIMLDKNENENKDGNENKDEKQNIKITPQKIKIFESLDHFEEIGIEEIKVEMKNLNNKILMKHYQENHFKFWEIIHHKRISFYKNKRHKII